MAEKLEIGEIEQFVKEFSDMLGTEATISCEISDSDEGDQKVVSIEFEGEDLGYMIGNRGAHLRGLQYVLSMMINKKFLPEGERAYVNVDVSGYKKQKFDKIERIALRTADDARILGDPVDMEPMTAAERRVVHMTLANFDDISTESFGEGRDRHVRIIPSGKISENMDDMFEDEVADELIKDNGES